MSPNAAAASAVAATPTTPADFDPSLLEPSDTFAPRHIGPGDAETAEMLSALGLQSLDELELQTVPASIRLQRPLHMPPPLSESQALAELKRILSKNELFRSLIGQGYYDTITPPVILRNILENPGWYTQYTPYQAEISQGRLEALLNFQTMVADLTALPLANASLLDEATAAAEAMAMCHALVEGNDRDTFIVAEGCHPQTLAVVQTRAESLGWTVRVVPAGSIPETDLTRVFGALVQYPTTDGRIASPKPAAEALHAAGALLVVATDLLALTLLTPPGELGADIAVGSAQRLGVPLGFGGPHAAFLSTRMEFARRLPGRLIGVSKDVHGRPALRLTLQTREQHIRREKATSNICTAQVLLAVMASMYAVYHGPEGLRRIARRVHLLTGALAEGLRRMGHETVGCTGGPNDFFDTLRVRPSELPVQAVLAAARAMRINLRDYGDGTVGISLDERSTREEVETLLQCFAGGATYRLSVDELAAAYARVSPLRGQRSPFLTHPTFHSHHSEHEMLRYLHRLQAKDLSLTTSMIPLGSCTMKLNATSEMLPVTWPEVANLHPFAPREQAAGYLEMIRQLEAYLAEITGFAAVSLQPNAGSQGEYAGLLAIRAYHASRGQRHRDVCLIPTSAHGTNPASAVIAGFKVVPVACDQQGNIDIDDLRDKARQHADRLAALMVTYPSTHGVFEPGIRQICDIVHEFGGQVYMDGANMNAQVGLCRPGDFGADVCHLNLHKTFCIPHGGGGPGVGPVCVAPQLAPFLPSTSTHCPRSGDDGGQPTVGPVAAAPFGSASILTISWMYIRMMGAPGLRKATQVAILNANYMARRLAPHYKLLYTGPGGRVAHEFILDMRPLEASAGIKVEDIAKRLMDYGFHAPTMSWPVPGTLMIEPTESESKAELDRFCDAMIAIRDEIARIESGQWPRSDNPLKNAPHTAEAIASANWSHPYTREQAAYPLPYLRRSKFWPPVGRVDNPYGDRNLVCACPPVSELS
ncbi:MAG: aminomethyl-transferring glycine dehydrogenase [Tepidisphaerales bacterium]